MARRRAFSCAYSDRRCQTFGLGGEQEAIEGGPNQLAGKKDISRVTVTVGKFAVPDLFDLNAYAYDPRTTFLNWNIYGGGSYDWTMDKLSWTWGAVVDFNQKNWAFRAGYFLLPVESNANNFDNAYSRPGTIYRRAGTAILGVLAAGQAAVVRMDEPWMDGQLRRRAGFAR